MRPIRLTLIGALLATLILLPMSPASACVEPWNTGVWIQVHSTFPTFSAWIIFHGFHTFAIPFPAGSQFCACGLGFPSAPFGGDPSKAGGPLFGSIESVDAAMVVGVDGFSFAPNASTSRSFEAQAPGTTWQGFLGEVSQEIPGDLAVEVRFDTVVTPGTDPAQLVKDIQAGNVGTAEGNADGTVIVDDHFSMLEIKDLEVQIEGEGGDIPEIPTLSSWGLLIFASLFSITALYLLRQVRGVGIF